MGCHPSAEEPAPDWKPRGGSREDRRESICAVPSSSPRRGLRRACRPSILSRQGLKAQILGGSGLPRIPEPLFASQVVKIPRRARSGWLGGRPRRLVEGRRLLLTASGARRSEGGAGVGIECVWLGVFGKTGSCLRDVGEEDGQRMCLSYAADNIPCL